jgi:intracellular sulfur oxidation DsrE/DsrF family protein
MSKPLRACLALCLAALSAVSMPLLAAENKSQAEWIYPVIPGFGGVHPRQDLPVRPDPAKDYRIFVQVVSAGKDPAKVNGALVRLARLVNLMGYAKVPPEHVHIVAVLDREAMLTSMTDQAYRQHLQQDHNPNLPLLHALKAAGVQLMICGQALAEHGIPDAAISPDVTITLSALTDIAVYGGLQLHAAVSARPVHCVDCVD